MENHHRNSGFSHWKWWFWWFSIAMSAITRGSFLATHLIKSMPIPARCCAHQSGIPRQGQKGGLKLQGRYGRVSLRKSMRIYENLWKYGIVVWSNFNETWLITNNILNQFKKKNNLWVSLKIGISTRKNTKMVTPQLNNLRGLIVTRGWHNLGWNHKRDGDDLGYDDGMFHH